MRSRTPSRSAEVPDLQQNDGVCEMLFGIVVATYRRRDGSTPGLLGRCLESILTQSHTSWRVYLIGDRYDDQKEFTILAQRLPPGKLVAVNLPTALERDDPSLQGEAFWCCAGTNACNTALELQRRDEVIVTCHLDDDDYWSHDHLSLLDTAYGSFPQAVFVYTQALHSTGHFLPGEDIPLAYDNLPPRPMGLIHSATSWRLDRIPVSYRNCPKQLGVNVPTDAQMWQDIGDFCRTDGLKTLYLPYDTVFHPTERTAIDRNLAEKMPNW